MVEAPLKVWPYPPLADKQQTSREALQAEAIRRGFMEARMFKHQGVWLPAGEKHFPSWMDKNGELIDGKGTYQIKKLRAALDHCRNFRVAVDVGAHVGLWSMQLLKRFKAVYAFEPVAAFRECWAENMPGNFVGVNGSIAIMHPVALGAKDGRAYMEIPALNGGIDSGGTHVRMAAVNDEDPSIVEVKALDSFGFADVDFVKIDCEGFEHQVIEGARDTITRCQPVIIVEQKPHKLGPNFGIKGTPAVDLLKGMGYRVVQELSGDFVMVPA